MDNQLQAFMPKPHRIWNERHNSKILPRVPEELVVVVKERKKMILKVKRV